jgi:hypothetical protein
MRARSWLSVRSSLGGFFPNMLRTYYELPQVAWATHFLYVRTERVCVLKRSLVFERILSNLVKIYYVFSQIWYNIYYG